MIPPRVRHSDYMRYAKLETDARYNLATSGVADASLSDLGVDLEALALQGPNVYGYPPLIEAIAARFHVPSACVVSPGGGCSFANHLAMASLIEPGDEAVIETPVYELLAAALGGLCARVTPIARRLETGWRLDLDAILARLRAGARLVVLTNLHNPTGAPISKEEIATLAMAAREADAWILIDEIYLELAHPDGAGPTAFDPEGRVVVTNGLTKIYGLSGLRCGWILAPTVIAERARRLNDLFGARHVFLAEQLAAAAFARLAVLRARTDRLIALNRAAYGELLGRHPALEQVHFDHGTTVFPRLRQGDMDGLARTLRARYETVIAPGRFFGLSDHMRLGLAGDPDMTREGFTRLAEALEAFPA